MSANISHTNGMSSFNFKGVFNSFGCLQPPQLGLKTNPPPIQEKPQKTTKKPPPAEELLKMTVRATQFINEKVH